MGVSLNRGSEKISKLATQGGQNKWGPDWERWLCMIIEQWNEQKHVVTKHKANIYTEASYFALRIGCI